MLISSGGLRGGEVGVFSLGFMKFIKRGFFMGFGNWERNSNVENDLN